MATDCGVFAVVFEGFLVERFVFKGIDVVVDADLVEGLGFFAEEFDFMEESGFGLVDPD